MLIIHSKPTCLNQRIENLGKLRKTSSHSFHVAPPSSNPPLNPLYYTKKEEEGEDFNSNATDMQRKEIGRDEDGRTFQFLVPRIQEDSRKKIDA